MPDPLTRVTGTNAPTGGVTTSTGGDTTIKDTAKTKPAGTVGGARDVDQIDATKRPALQPPSPAEVKAVRTLRQLIDSGRLKAYYDAAIGIGDASLKEQALALFDSLPKINGDITAERMVALGLWTTAPRGLAELQQAARYLPGRQVLCRTNVNADLFNSEKFLSYDPNGPLEVTHRAQLVGEKGDAFLIKVDGKEEPIERPKSEIFALNDAHDFFDGPDRLRNGLYSGGLSKRVDYNDRFLKAKLCEAAISIDEKVGRLDFTQMVAPGSGGLMRVFGRGQAAEKMVDIQKACVKGIHDVIDMDYPGHASKNQDGREQTDNAGRAAVKGWGHCDQQNSVFVALVAPFQELLGVDLKMFYGHCYRSKKQGDNPFNFQDPHSWAEVTFRPSAYTLIYDRTWNQPGERPWYMFGGRDKDLTPDIAYSKAGDRCPSRSWFKGVAKTRKATDVNMSGDFSVQTYARQFGVDGQDGRQHHI